MWVRALTTAVVLLGLAAMPAGAANKRSLRAFKSCPQLLSYARAHGQAAVKTGWVPTPFAAASEGPSRVPKNTGGSKSTEGTAVPQAAEDNSGAGGSAGTDYSTTN